MDLQSCKGSLDGRCSLPSDEFEYCCQILLAVGPLASHFLRRHRHLHPQSLDRFLLL